MNTSNLDLAQQEARTFLCLAAEGFRGVWFGDATLRASLVDKWGLLAEELLREPEGVSAVSTWAGAALEQIARFEAVDAVQNDKGRRTAKALHTRDLLASIARIGVELRLCVARWRDALSRSNAAAASNAAFVAGLLVAEFRFGINSSRLRRGGGRTEKGVNYLAAVEAQPGVKRAAIDHELAAREKIKPESVARGRQRAERRRRESDRT